MSSPLSSTQPTSFPSIPQEIFIDHIFQFLPGNTLHNTYRLVNRSWNQAIQIAKCSQVVVVFGKHQKDFLKVAEKGYFKRLMAYHFAEDPSTDLCVLDYLPKLESVVCNVKSRAFLKTLLEHPKLTVKRLKIWVNVPGVIMMDALDSIGTHSHLSGLTQLKLIKVWSPKVINSLFSEDSKLTNLTDLKMKGMPIENKQELFNIYPRMSKLKRLALCRCKITEVFMEYMLQSNFFSNLQYMDVSDNELKQNGVSMILRKLPNITSLKANDTQCDNVKELIEIGKNLNSLEVANSKIGYSGSKQLSVLEDLSRITHLNVSGCKIGGGAAHLLTSPHLCNIKSLNLYDNCVGNTGCEAISKNVHLSNLTHLNLSTNMVRSEGVQMLFKSAHLCNLRYLNLDINTLDDSGGLFIANNPCPARLCKLLIKGNRLSQATMDKIVQSPHLASVSVEIFEQNLQLTKEVACPFINNASYLKEDQ